MGDLSGKLEVEVEVKVAADQLFNIMRTENHQIPNAASDKVHTVEVHEGDWGLHGSIKLWQYTVDGKVENMKERIEVDDANKCVTFVFLGGHVMEEFKSYGVVYRVIPNPNDDGSSSSSVAKIAIEYEKLNLNVPDPTRYLQLLVNVTKDIEEHLLNPST